MLLRRMVYSLDTLGKVQFPSSTRVMFSSASIFLISETKAVRLLMGEISLSHTHTHPFFLHNCTTSCKWVLLWISTKPMIHCLWLGLQRQPNLFCSHHKHHGYNAKETLKMNLFSSWSVAHQQNKKKSLIWRWWSTEYNTTWIDCNPPLALSFCSYPFNEFFLMDQVLSEKGKTLNCLM